MPRYLSGNRCTVQMSTGEFCDAQRAVDMPFPICFEHAMRVYRTMQDMVEDVTLRGVMVPETAENLVADWRQEKNSPAHRVYYLKVGELIKIGTTKQKVKTRLRAYPPGSELLALERGGHHVEQRRHHQFSHLLARGKEWFHPGADLLDHMTKLGIPAGLLRNQR